ncbi:SGNH/GDSL hydrolase family protein [Patulibacter sp. SYSU D01012]|uniref:SGNH/GDSL hydrolase family protein n=1 Tax=Patulibacter sp. SYSU D01012 TaxID=2817381 RepID=UPI001B306D38
MRVPRAATPAPASATPAPDRVADLRAAAHGSAGVALSWTPVARATGYRIERTDLATGAVQALGGADVTGRYVDVPPPELAGHWLAYRVVATSPTAAAPPSAPVEARAAGIPAYRAFYALGDSYAAGTGLGQPYDDQTCSRSNELWAALISRELVPEPRRIACSGATTADVMPSSAGGVKQHPELSGTQLDEVRSDLTTATGPALVTLSIGGNDARFIPQFTRCVLGDCTGDRDAETALIRGPVRQALDATFAEVRRVAPAADVLVAGYPRLFTEDVLPTDPLVLTTLTLAERRLANAWADQLNAEVAASAIAHGLHPVTDEVISAFLGHGAGGADPWINGVELLDVGTPVGTSPSVPATKSVHPNAAGNAAYGAVMEEALRRYASQVQVR